VLLIDVDGEKLGVMLPEEALARAEDMELDLVEVAPKANPPVCKIRSWIMASTGMSRANALRQLKSARNLSK